LPAFHFDEQVEQLLCRRRERPAATPNQADMPRDRGLDERHRHLHRVPGRGQGDRGHGGKRAAQGNGDAIGFAQRSFGVSAAFTRMENNLTATGAFKDTALGGSYDFGVVRLSAAWRKFEQSSASQTHLLIGAWVPVGAGEVKLSWNRADLSGAVGAAAIAAIAANDASQIGLGYVHNLSKRTAVYGTLARIDNKAAATFQVPGGPAGLAGGGSSSGMEFGLRHSF
jgi:predicted porin